MTRVNDSFCELKSVVLTTKSVGIGQLTRITESPIPDSRADLSSVLHQRQRRQQTNFRNLNSDKIESENGLFVVFADAAHCPVAIAARFQKEEATALYAVCLRETAEHARTEGTQSGRARQE